MFAARSILQQPRDTPAYTPNPTSFSWLDDSSDIYLHLGTLAVFLWTTWSSGPTKVQGRQVHSKDELLPQKDAVSVHVDLSANNKGAKSSSIVSGTPMLAPSLARVSAPSGPAVTGSDMKLSVHGSSAGEPSGQHPSTGPLLTASGDSSAGTGRVSSPKARSGNALLVSGLVSISERQSSEPTVATQRQ